ncbi:hypothetical protein DERF_011306 [Dermatophagoides farinae]|uniref:Uncharacterized protein n=1 Tax=Dermatophagoides farinae TaxID=6954 RepID=A0A922HSN7_DERFA|nr:hypothetical protein DERF_011306 [Dermatophagoides farinae]
MFWNGAFYLTITNIEHREIDDNFVSDKNEWTTKKKLQRYPIEFLVVIDMDTLYQLIINRIR